MTRTFALAATVALASVTAIAQPAAAVTADPVKAIERQLSRGKGVRISETVRHSYGPSRTSGTGSPAGYGWRGPARRRSRSPGGTSPATTRPTRRSASARSCTATPRSTRYRCRRARRGCGTPAGPGTAGRWRCAPGCSRSTSTTRRCCGPCCAARRGTAVRGGYRYQGAISYRELSRIVPKSYRHPATNARVTAASKGELAWRLFTGRDGLPTRLITTSTQGSGRSAVVMRVDTRYSGWGRRGHDHRPARRRDGRPGRPVRPARTRPGAALRGRELTPAGGRAPAGWPPARPRRGRARAGGRAGRAQARRAWPSRSPGSRPRSAAAAGCQRTSRAVGAWYGPARQARSRSEVPGARPRCRSRRGTARLDRPADVPARGEVGRSAPRAACGGGGRCGRRSSRSCAAPGPTRRAGSARPAGSRSRSPWTSPPAW